VVLPNGVDLLEIDAATPADPRRAVAELLPGLGGASPVFVSVGRVERYKGFGDVLEALIRLHAGGRLPPGWAWVVIGEGAEKAMLKDRIAAVDAAGGALGPHIHFAGWVRGNAELHAYYARADVFVHATHYEGSSIVTLEAMAHALPVAATRAGGIPDKVTSGENGFLVEPGDVSGLTDALAVLAADPSLRQRMGRAGRTRVERSFSWDGIAERTIAVYEEMLREAAPAS
jgi:glycosyltransferase involved in cell wall biosynthesis